MSRNTKEKNWHPKGSIDSSFCEQIRIGNRSEFLSIIKIWEFRINCILKNSPYQPFFRKMEWNKVCVYMKICSHQGTGNPSLVKQRPSPKKKDIVIIFFLTDALIRFLALTVSSSARRRVATYCAKYKYLSSRNRQSGRFRGNIQKNKPPTKEKLTRSRRSRTLFMSKTA